MKDITLNILKTKREKSKGLLGKEKIGINDLYLFVDTNHVHTVGMKFPIKVIFLDEKAEIVSIVLLKPDKEYKEEKAVAFIECHPFFNSSNLNEIKEKIIKAL